MLGPVVIAVILLLILLTLISRSERRRRTTSRSLPSVLIEALVSEEVVGTEEQMLLTLMFI